MVLNQGTATYTGATTLVTRSSLSDGDLMTAGPQPTPLTVSGQAALSITKGGPVGANVGAAVLYTITVQNAGPSPAVNVWVTDTPPPGLSFINNEGACSTAFPCALGIVPAGATRVISSTYSVPANYAWAGARHQHGDSEFAHARSQQHRQLGFSCNHRPAHRRSESPQVGDAAAAGRGRQRYVQRPRRQPRSRRRAKRRHHRPPAAGPGLCCRDTQRRNLRPGDGPLVVPASRLRRRIRAAPDRHRHRARSADECRRGQRYRIRSTRLPATTGRRRSSTE